MVLAIVFTGLIVIVTALVFLLPKLTEAKDVKIPDVSNLSVQEAESELENEGFKVAAETKDATSDSVEVGNVVKTSPASGRTVKEGLPVNERGRGSTSVHAFSVKGRRGEKKCQRQRWYDFVLSGDERNAGLS